MKLRTLSKIEFVIKIGLMIVAFPFYIIETILSCISAPFTMVVDRLALLAQYIGNKLLKYSDEVKDGTIKYQYYIRNSTASFALKMLNKEVNLK